VIVTGVALLTWLLPAMPAAATFWQQAAQRYGVSADLLYAIAQVESDLRPQAVNRGHLARTGSYDIGLMQINSSHLPTLRRYGIGERDLFDPCTSIHVGAWILAGNVQRLGYTWEAVGAYNAANPELRRAYVEKVRRHLRGTGAAAHSARHSHTSPAFVRGDHRPPVVATLP
jgi:soluble lytic murein transglycosylase-like protein